MKVRLTKIDIRDGEQENCDYCPIALALKRAAKTEHVFVGINYILVGPKGYPIPAKVMKWIRDFDEGKEVKLITFSL